MKQDESFPKIPNSDASDHNSGVIDRTALACGDENTNIHRENVSIPKHKRIEAQLSALISASQNLYKKRSFTHLARSVIDLARPAVSASLGCVAMVDDEDNHLHAIIFDSSERSPKLRANEVVPLYGIIGRAFRSKKPLFTNDITRTESFNDLPVGLKDLSNLMVCPFVLKKQAVGIMLLGNKPGCFTEDDADIAQAFCHLLTISLSNTRSWEALQASEERFRQFFNSEPNYCLIISPEGIIIDVNRACLEMMEFERNALIGKPWWLMYDENSMSWIKNKPYWEHPLILQNCELGIRSASGLLHHVLATTSATTGEDGELLHYVTVLIDITRRVEIETEQQRLLGIYQEQSESLSRSNHQLESALRQVRESEHKMQRLYEQEKKLRDELEIETQKRADFTRTLVHELKTPLVPLVASSSLLSDGLQEEPWQSIARNIERGALNLSNRIEELLDVARGEIGALIINPIEMNLLPLLRDIVTESRDLTSVRQQHLDVQLPSSLPSVKGDTERLRQVIVNILNNAVKYTPEDGHITLTVTAEDDFVQIAVRDTGLGIPPEDVQQIFSSYYRSSNSRLLYHGMGVGLYLCKKIMELHGGDITVSSLENSGSTFTIFVPVFRSFSPPIRS